MTKCVSHLSIIMLYGLVTSTLWGISGSSECPVLSDTGE